MKPSEIEIWALNVLESVNNRRRVEDSRVELKAEWPADPAKAARRLAAHANAARGENILWLIGVDEDTGVKGVAYQELSNWYSRVESQFDGVAPRIIDVNVPCTGMAVAALCFQTDRAPYVVKNPAFGSTKGEPVEWEVPWRDGTRTRTARRAELLMVLGPTIYRPKIELLGGHAAVATRKNSNDPSADLSIELDLYVVPISGAPVVFPFHRAALTVSPESSANIIIKRPILRPVRNKQMGEVFRSMMSRLNREPSAKSSKLQPMTLFSAAPAK